jgi:hypothetical protein
MIAKITSIWWKLAVKLSKFAVGWKRVSSPKEWHISHKAIYQNYCTFCMRKYKTQ